MTDIPLRLGDTAVITPSTLRRIISEHADDLPNLKVTEDSIAVRMIDPTVVVATISAVSTVLVATLPKLIEVLGNRVPREGKLTVRFDRGEPQVFDVGGASSAQDASSRLSLEGRSVTAIEYV